MQVIIKPTRACNGTCVYCAATAALHDDMPLREERFGPLFEAFAPWLREDPNRKLSFIWHGGEPLMMGIDFYRKAMQEQERVFGDEVPRVGNIFQSNLTLLTEEWLPFLKRFVGSGIGTSFDVVEGVRGLNSGEPLAERWLPAVEMCRKAGIGVGVVYVVHRESLARAKEIYYFFRNLQPNSGVRYNPLYREGRAGEADADDLGITPEEYGRFLVELATLWWEDGRRTSIAPISEWATAWEGRPELLCCESTGRCHETHLGLGPDGSAFTCGRHSDNKDESLRLGNVFEDPLSTILAHPARTVLAERSPKLREGFCRDCSYWSLCHGGCPMMARLYYDDSLRETYFCAARKAVYGYLEGKLGPPPAAQGLPGGDATGDWL